MEAAIEYLAKGGQEPGRWRDGSVRGGVEEDAVEYVVVGSGSILLGGRD